MAKRSKKKRPHQVAPPGRRLAASVEPEVELRRGLAAFERSDYDTAVQAWKQARQGGAGARVERALAEAHFRRSLAASNAARRAQELQQAVALAPGQALYHYHLGLAYQRQGQLPRARTAYEAAQHLAPGDQRVRCQLALARLPDPESAAALDELLAPNLARGETAARLRALAALRQNDPTGALATLAALKNPSPFGTLALGLAQLAAGQCEAASESLARVRRSRRPLSAEARQAAAIAAVVTQTRAGDLAGALKALLALDVPDEPTLRGALTVAARGLAQELLLDERGEDSLLAWQAALAVEPGADPTRRVCVHLHEILATRAARQGDLASAAQHWAAALAQDPGNSRVCRNLALVAERLENWPSASDRWEELIQVWKKELRGRPRGDEAGAELRRRLVVAYDHLAAAYDAADDIRAATRALETALNFDPSQVDFRLRAAELYLENEEHARAIEHLRQVLAERPNDTRVLLDLGSAYDLRGDDHKAQEHLEQALSLEPENPAVRATLASVHHGRGHRLQRSGQAERASAEFQRAVQLEPDNAEHHECLGGAYLELGQPGPGRAALERAVALAPKDPRNLTAIAGVYLDHGYQKEADKLFRQALRVDRSPMTHIVIGLAYLRRGYMKKAHQQLEPLLKGREPLLLGLIGKLLINMKQEEDAIRYLERALAFDPLSARARLDLAWALTFGRRDYDRAAIEIEEAERSAKVTGETRLLAEIADAREALRLMAAAPHPTGLPGALGGLWR